MELSERHKEILSAVVPVFQAVIQNLMVESELLNIIITACRDRLDDFREWSCVEQSTYWEEDVPKFSDKKFKNVFRMERTTFYSILENLSALKKQDTNYRKAIPIDKRLGITLYALGSSSEYRVIAGKFGVGRSSVCRIVMEVCREIIKVYKKCFDDFYPATQEKINENVAGFLKLGFPQCYGAIDGCHINIKPPKLDARDYYSYKRSYSIILFAAVDYRYRFMYLSVGSPGKCSDSTIWESSRLKKEHIDNPVFKENCKTFGGVSVPVLLIGDSVFRLSPLVMKPYTFTLQQPEDERRFNARLSSSRRVVENAFGHLKARFRRIGKGIDNHIKNTTTIVLTCCILHNMLNDCNDQINSKWVELLERESLRRRHRFRPNNTSHQNRNEIRRRQQVIQQVNNGNDQNGNEIRDAIKNHLGLLGVEERDEDVDVDSAVGVAVLRPVFITATASEYVPSAEEVAGSCIDPLHIP